LTAKGWQREFEDPIPLPSGRKLITLREPPTTSNTFTNLPKKEIDLMKIASRSRGADAGVA
jgi:hypothetical protein